MKKEHSVFITVSGAELCQFINREARRIGALKDVKSTVPYELWDKEAEVTLEYSWDEEIK